MLDELRVDVTRREQPEGCGVPGRRRDVETGIAGQPISTAALENIGDHLGVGILDGTAQERAGLLFDAAS